MPYLTQEQKEALDNGMLLPDTPGALNYVITAHALNLAANDDLRLFESAVEVEVTNYLATCSRVGYEAHNAVMGVLSCAAREWARRRGPQTARDQSVGDTLADYADNYYRTVVAPYEDEKIRQNGDVYTS